MSMVCEICHEAIATVHLTEIVNNAKKEIHLCEACAQQKGVAITSSVKNLSIPEFFGQLVEPKESSASPEPLECPNCGLTYRDFRSSGKLGCAEDYEHFRGELNQLIERIHGVSHPHHRGKVPSQIGRQVDRLKQIESLRGELKTAVEMEQYERAASLRDRIQELEQETCR